MMVMVHDPMAVSVWDVPVKWDIGNYERKIRLYKKLAGD